MSERGVSEVISFALVFSLVVTTVGVVYVSGFTGLEDTRDAERVNNAERAFDVLADNMADIYSQGVPSRKTEVKLADSQLSLDEPTMLTVTVEDVTDADGYKIVYEAETRPLVFSTDGPTQIVYEAGAVIRTDRQGGRLLSEPPLLITEESTVIQYVVLTSSSGRQSLGGSSTVLVRGVRTGRNVLVSDDSQSKVTLTIETTTKRALIWEEYINERADWSGSDWKDGDNVPCETADLGDGRSEVTCTFQPDSFYLSSIGIRTELSS
jgi:hypothetical protein